MSPDTLEKFAPDVTEEPVPWAQPDDAARARQPPRPTTPWYRRPLGLLVVLIVGVALITGGTLWWLQARHWESTDDAFIDTHMVMVAPQVAGRVARVLVDDTKRLQPANCS